MDLVQLALAACWCTSVEHWLQTLPYEAASTIAKDVPRSFPEYDYFSRQGGKADLEKVLHAYAACDPEVGYCQGLNFLAGTILLYCPDAQEAFEVLHVLLYQKGMRCLYLPSFVDLEVRRFSQLQTTHLATARSAYGSSYPPASKHTIQAL
jgi:hypothetical protein